METHTKPDAEFDRDAKAEGSFYVIWSSIIQLGKALDAAENFKSNSNTKRIEIAEGGGEDGN
jgi:hypothetical protein